MTPIFGIYIFLECVLWVQRLITMLPSVRRYSVMSRHQWASSENPPKVSLIIPCRNEERNLPRLLPTLAGQNYPNLEIVLIDDRSSDKTLQMLQSFGRSHSHIKVLEGKPKPSDWTGKAHALHQAVQQASGEWYLFSDADTQHQPDSVSSSVYHAIQRKIDFLTLTSHYMCESFAEYLIQPMAIGCFSVWFRLQDVNNPKSQVPLACGHYILIRKDAYESLGGFEAIKDEVLEDLALFKRAKKNGKCRFELAIGADIFSTRMYDSWPALWSGWLRIFTHSLERKSSVLVSKIAALLINSALPFVTLTAGLFYFSQGSGALQFLIATNLLLCGFIIILRIESHKAIKIPAWPAFFHPISSMIIAAILIDCLIHHLLSQKVAWRGEKY